MFSRIFSRANLKLVFGILRISNGGTGASTASAARTNLDVYSKSEIDGLIVSSFNDRGNFDASSNSFPSTGGSGSAGAIKKGDMWQISAAGTLGGSAVEIGDVLRSLVDTPGQTASNWIVTERNLGYVPVNKTGDTMSGILVMSQSLYFSSNTESLSGTKTLVSTSPQYQFLNPNGAARDVLLPSPSANMFFIIKNTGNLGNNLTVKDSGGTVITGGTISNGVSMGFYYTGTSWEIV